MNAIELIKIQKNVTNAIQHHHSEMAKNILEELNSDDRKAVLCHLINGDSLLTHARMSDYMESVDLILECAQQYELDLVNVQNVQNAWGLTPLFFAIFSNDIVMASRLLKVPGINANVQMVTGFTPLMTAAMKGKYEMTSLLLKQSSIRIDLKNNAGETALDIATKEGHREIVELLLSFQMSNLQ